MKIVQITPGAGKMYCGACFRDYALVKALRNLGHSVVMMPLYLPASIEYDEPEPETPIFFGGISVYLEQKSALARRMPRWMRRVLASPWLLNRVSGKAASTQPADLGDLTLSMLNAETAPQSQELEDMIAWLKTEKPDVISLSNALLIGMARRLKSELGVPVVCSLQGEDEYINSLPAPFNEMVWQTMAERAADIDLFIAPSQYFRSLMGCRLNLKSTQVQVVHNGIDLNGFKTPTDNVPLPAPSGKPLIGFFGRMCPEKGLDVLVEAFVILRKRGHKVGLRIGGYCGPGESAFVGRLKDRLNRENCLSEAKFHPNVTRAQKLEFLHSLTVFSTPATYSEAFGLYVLEALAAGVPIVQPDHAAFPELIGATRGGVLCQRSNPDSLALEIEKLLKNPAAARAMGQAGRVSVFANFGMERMAREIGALFGGL